MPVIVHKIVVRDGKNGMKFEYQDQTFNELSLIAHLTQEGYTLQHATKIVTDKIYEHEQLELKGKLRTPHDILEMWMRTPQRELTEMQQIVCRIYSQWQREVNRPERDSLLHLGFMDIEKLVVLFSKEKWTMPWETHTSNPQVNPIQKRPVVTLCGSTKFQEEFNEANRRHTLAGYLVFSCGVFGHTEPITLAEHAQFGYMAEIKPRLDQIHKQKIDMSDEIYVINKGGYIGESTLDEIAYASIHGKTVKFLEEPDAEVMNRILKELEEVE